MMIEPTAIIHAVIKLKNAFNFHIDLLFKANNSNIIKRKLGL